MIDLLFLQQKRKEVLEIISALEKELGIVEAYPVTAKLSEADMELRRMQACKQLSIPSEMGVE